MKHLNKKKVYAYSLPILAFLLIVILSYGGYHYLQRSQSVARVNGTYIDADIHSERISHRQMFLENQSQVANPEAISQDVLNLIIDEALISQYAQDNDISVTQTEIDTRYRQLIDTNGETELEDRLAELYGPRGVDNYSEVIRADILRDKVQAALPGVSLREWLENERSEAQIDIFRQE